jgi:hypothetical protein
VLVAGELSMIHERFVGSLMEELIFVYNRAEREVALALEACRSGGARSTSRSFDCLTAPALGLRLPPLRLIPSASLARRG